MNISGCTRLNDKCLQALSSCGQEHMPAAQHCPPCSLSDWTALLEQLNTMLHDSFSSLPECLQQQQLDAVMPSATALSCYTGLLPDLTELFLAETSGISTRAILGLALSGRLTRLRVLDVSFLPSGANQPFTELTAVFKSAGPHLQNLKMDACRVNDQLIADLAQNCSMLKSLSVIGCRGLTAGAMAQLAVCCPLLENLGIGGAMFVWGPYGTAMAAFRNLQCLKIVRQNCLTDSQLLPLLTASAKTLSTVTFAGCSSLTDNILKVHAFCQTASATSHLAYTAHERFIWLQALPTGITTLTLTCCDRLSGKGLLHLQKLETLRLPGCQAIAIEHLRVRFAERTLLMFFY